MADEQFLKMLESIDSLDAVISKIREDIYHQVQQFKKDLSQ